MRCWLELEQQAGISPCVLLGEMNDRGKIASCEVDVGSAVTMYALKLATGTPSACLDWNNNYGDEDDKCILFHCGPVPMSLMTQRGKIEDHAFLQTPWERVARTDVMSGGFGRWHLHSEIS